MPGGRVDAVVGGGVVEARLREDAEGEGGDLLDLVPEHVGGAEEEDEGGRAEGEPQAPAPPYAALLQTRPSTLPSSWRRGAEGG